MMRTRAMPSAVLVWALARTMAGCGDGGSDPVAGASMTEGTASSDDSGDATGVVGRVCTPGEVRSCYEGPLGTQGLGVCTAGQQTCAADGTAWSECAGQVEPGPVERCDTPQDDDCDGSVQCEPTLAWWQRFSGDTHGIALDGEGNAVVVGVAGAFDFQGADIHGVYVLEVDAEGELRWSRTFEGQGSIHFGGVEIDDQGRVTVVGYYEGSPDFGGGPLPSTLLTNAFIARFAPDGSHLFSHAYPVTTFSELALGPDGSAYAIGYGVDYDLDGFPHEVLVIAAYDDAGALAWAHHGYGIFGLREETQAIVVSGPEHDVWLLATMGDEGLLDPQIGGMMLDIPEFATYGIRFDAAGAPRGYQGIELSEEVYNVYDVEAFSRPDGSVTIASNVAGSWEGSAGQSLMIGHFDAAMQPQSVERIGDPAWGSHVAPAADGTTLIGVDFGGVLDLGPIGVGVPQFGRALALGAVDDEGNGRWLELMYTQDFIELQALAGGADGSVLIAVTVVGSSALVGEPVSGSLLARLQP